MTNLDLASELAAANQLAASRGRSIGLTSLIGGPAALDSLPLVVKQIARPGGIVLLEDSTVMWRCGRELKPLVAELLGAVGDVSRIVLGTGHGPLHADPSTLEAARAAAAHAGCVVTVGSGTLTDVGKDAARAAGAPLVAVQTAASVNGYADDMAVILKDGVKRTVPSVWPAALIIDTAVLVDAPLALTLSGYAEMLAMFTAPADWRLAAAVGHDDHFDPQVLALFRPRGETLLASASGLRAGDGSAIELLATLLTTSGIAMGISGRTAPLSGLEHLISHLIDMSAANDRRPVGLHGAQVGVASLLAACVWERLLARLDPRELLCDAPDPTEMRRRVDAAFCDIDHSGRTSDECWSDYREKLARWAGNHDHRTVLVESWPAVRDDLAALVGDPVAMVNALRAAGAPTRFGELDPAIDPARVRWAVASSHLMRDRFTVTDLAFLTGHWNNEDITAVLDRAADLAGGP
jgi:glycerol-1-phosphate dehydrogenase [NAD(P)+]